MSDNLNPAKDAQHPASMNDLDSAIAVAFLPFFGEDAGCTDRNVTNLNQKIVTVCLIHAGRIFGMNQALAGMDGHKALTLDDVMDFMIQNLLVGERLGKADALRSMTVTSQQQGKANR